MGYLVQIGIQLGIVVVAWFIAVGVATFLRWVVSLWGDQWSHGDGE